MVTTATIKASAPKPFEFVVTLSEHDHAITDTGIIIKTTRESINQILTSTSIDSAVVLDAPEATSTGDHVVTIASIDSAVVGEAISPTNTSDCVTAIARVDGTAVEDGSPASRYSAFTSDDVVTITSINGTFMVGETNLSFASDDVVAIAGINDAPLVAEDAVGLAITIDEVVTITSLDSPFEIGDADEITIASGLASDYVVTIVGIECQN